VIIGLGLTVVLVLFLTVQAIFYPVMAERERCMSGANTLKAKDNCDQAYQDRLEDLTDDLRRRAGQSP
jgi:cytochrome c-type biogenesis protein CcmH/NrfG